MDQQLVRLIREIPKAENHYHIDVIGPQMALEFSRRNGIEMPFHTLEEARAFYRFTTLDEFIAVLLSAMSTIRTSQDFEDIVVACAQDMRRQNVVYREAMFDYTASHQTRGLALEDVVAGFAAGTRRAREEYGVDIRFIANLDRTAPVEKNLAYLRELLQVKGDLPLIAVGLDMAEVGHPASSQRAAFDFAAENGLLKTAHAGEDAGPDAIRDAWHGLDLDRIDHGVRACEDPRLMDELAQSGMLCTLCPASNVSLGVFPSWEDYPIRQFLDAGVHVSVSSDDPPCYGYDLTENLVKLAEVFDLTAEQVVGIVRGSFSANFAGQEHVSELDAWLAGHAIASGA